MVAEIGKPGSKVMDGITSVQHVEPGYLVFGRDGTLLAQRFDPRRRASSANPFPSLNRSVTFSTGVSTFTFTSLSGVLVYPVAQERGRIVWLDRAGREVGTIAEGLRAFSGMTRTRRPPGALQSNTAQHRDPRHMAVRR